MAWATFGPIMWGYPGFYCGKDGDPAFAGPEGLLLPTHDIDDNVVALQVRPDAVVGPKRVWLSSVGRYHGTGSGAPAHISRPMTASAEFSGKLYIVEGVLNADICSDRLSAVCIGLSGVTNWRAIDWQAIIRRFACNSVVIALDMDAEVTRVDAERALIRAAIHGHTAVRVASWDPVLAKGFDDCLNASLQYSIT